MSTIKSLSERIVALLLAFILVIHVGHADVNVPTGARLKTLAAQDGVLVGTGVSGYAFSTSPYGTVLPADYLTYVTNDFAWIQPENVVIWENTEATQGVFNYTWGDSVVGWGNANGANVHCGHLVWGYFEEEKVPYLSSTSTWTAATLKTEMLNHIDNVMGHYNADSTGTLKCTAWNVVNEALSDTGTDTVNWTNDTRGSTDIFNKWIGTGYIADCFAEARAVDANTTLIYNDYNCEDETVNPVKSNAMYNMVASLKSSNLIDAVGFESHWALNSSLHPTIPNYTGWANNLARFSNLGVYIYCTEFDDPQTSGTNGNVPSLTNDDQARVYYNILDKALRCPMFRGFQTWDYSDAESWWNGIYSAYNIVPTPLEFDGQWVGGSQWPANNPNFMAKPAYYAMQDALATEDRSEVTTNGGFESGVSPWTNNGTGALSIDTSNPHSGTSDLMMSGRSASWGGACEDVTTQLQAQGSGRYYFSDWARFVSGTGTVQLLLQLTDTKGTHYQSINQAVGTSWTQVSGWMNVTWFANLTDAKLIIETVGTTADFCIDDLRMGDGNILANGNFENGTSSWVGGSGATIAASTADAQYHYGAGGVACTARSYTFQSPEQNVLSTLLAEGPGNYNFQTYMKLASGTGTGEMTLVLTYGGTSYYLHPATGSINSTGWTKVATTTPVSVTWTSPLTSAVLYMETPGSTVDFYADDMVVRQ